MNVVNDCFKCRAIETEALKQDLRIRLKKTYPGNAKVTTALMVDTAGLQDWLALPGGSKSHSGKGNDEEDSGFKELHDWLVNC